MNLLAIALAPVLIILVYVYFRDRYEKEPLGLLVRGLIAGAVITIPIIFTERLLMTPAGGLTGMQAAAYHSFIVASLSEESFKLIALLLFFWRHKEFSERFDGIVYAVFVSLGFAAVENVMFVLSSGIETGIMRAVTAVPAHAIFGITMGYYLGLARFIPEQKRKYLVMAVFYPFILHGIYDFLLLSGHPVLLLLFIPYLIFLWRSGTRKMKRLNIENPTNIS